MKPPPIDFFLWSQFCVQGVQCIIKGTVWSQFCIRNVQHYKKESQFCIQYFQHYKKELCVKPVLHSDFRNVQHFKKELCKMSGTKLQVQPQCMMLKSMEFDTHDFCNAVWTILIKCFKDFANLHIAIWKMHIVQIFFWCCGHNYSLFKSTSLYVCANIYELECPVPIPELGLPTQQQYLDYQPH